MRLGLMTGYSGGRITLPLEMIRLADRLGYYAVWTAEAYGSDAVSPLAWIGALTQRIRHHRAGKRTKLERLAARHNCGQQFA